MKMLRHSVAVFVVVSLIAGAWCARAAVDVTGRWNVTMQSVFFGQLPASLDGVASPVVAELHARSPLGNACWQSSFPASATKHSARTLHAKLPSR